MFDCKCSHGITIFDSVSGSTWCSQCLNRMKKSIPEKKEMFVVGEIVEADVFDVLQEVTIVKIMGVSAVVENSTGKFIIPAHKLKKLQDKKEMKHPCGKVFDAKEEFICEDGDEVEDFLLGINKISVKFKRKQTIYDYKLCGHQLCVDNSDYCPNIKNNLINIVEIVDWNKPICVVNEVSGKEYEAFVRNISSEFVEVRVFLFANSEWGVLFSADGKECNRNFSSFKLVAKNV